MIYARPADTFDATTNGAPTGLTGTLGVRVIDQPAGATMLARTTAGISEQPPGSGIYSVTLIAPAIAGSYLVVWDTGGATPVYALEELQVAGVLPADVVISPGGNVVVSFTDYTPPPRYDGQSWTQARIEEAAAATGPWALIDTKTLTPDLDPTNPVPRSFTTELATLDSGWYRVAWVDAQGDASAPTEPIPNVAGGGAVPTVDEVAALLQERTWANGVQQSTFNTDTTPTADQAQRLIDLAVDDVLIAFGGAIPTGYESRARMLATLRAATLIENSFFRRDVENNTSPYAQYQAMYLADLERLGEDPGVASGRGGFASVRVVPAVVDPLARLLP
jgi:hypothetical protein